jgi:hypothetical protein
MVFLANHTTIYHAMPTSPTRQGNTEAECYNELKCSDYCCVNDKLTLKDVEKITWEPQIPGFERRFPYEKKATLLLGSMLNSNGLHMGKHGTRRSVYFSMAMLP